MIALKPCGPVIDAEAAERARERLSASASEAGWGATLDAAWPALAPVFAAWRRGPRRDGMR